MILKETTIGPCRLILGDCREILPQLKYDAIISDPPYGIKFKKGRQHQDLGFGVTGTKCNYKPIQGDKEPFSPPHLFNAVAYKSRKLGIQDTVIAVMGANHYAKHIPDNGQWLVWDKSCGQGPASSFVDAEFMWMNRRNARCIYRQFWLGGLRSGRGSQCYGPRLHVSQKPVELMMWIMETARVGLGKTVCDPYMGSGSTGEACLLTGRKFIGIEIDEEHYLTACGRLEKVHAEITAAMTPDP